MFEAVVSTGDQLMYALQCVYLCTSVCLCVVCTCVCCVCTYMCCMCVCGDRHTYTHTQTHIPLLTEEHNLKHHGQKINHKKNFDGWESYIDSVLKDYQLTGTDSVYCLYL